MLSNCGCPPVGARDAMFHVFRVSPAAYLPVRSGSEVRADVSCRDRWLRSLVAGQANSRVYRVIERLRRLHWSRSPSFMCGGVLIPSMVCADGCACIFMLRRTCRLITWLSCWACSLALAAFMFAKQSDVTPRFTLDNVCFWCEQLTCPPYTGLGGAVAPFE